VRGKINLYTFLIGIVRGNFHLGDTDEDDAIKLKRKEK
jgi:hypothetical protein